MFGLSKTDLVVFSAAHTNSDSRAGRQTVGWLFSEEKKRPAWLNQTSAQLKRSKTQSAHWSDLHFNPTIVCFYKYQLPALPACLPILGVQGQGPVAYPPTPHPTSSGCWHDTWHIDDILSRAIYKGQLSDWHTGSPGCNYYTDYTITAGHLDGMSLKRQAMQLHILSQCLLIDWNASYFLFFFFLECKNTFLRCQETELDQ